MFPAHPPPPKKTPQPPSPFALLHTQARELDEKHFGPDIAFREHSFLANPRLPAATKASVLHVTFCAPGNASCAAPKAEAGRITLPPRLSGEQLVAALKEAYAGVSVLQLHGVTTATFSGYDSQARGAPPSARSGLWVHAWLRTCS